jgi:hypothetical protein
MNQPATLRVLLAKMKPAILVSINQQFHIEISA